MVRPVCDKASNRRRARSQPNFRSLISRPFTPGHLREEPLSRPPAAPAQSALPQDPGPLPHRLKQVAGILRRLVVGDEGPALCAFQQICLAHDQVPRFARLGNRGPFRMQWALPRSEQFAGAADDFRIASQIDRAQPAPTRAINRAKPELRIPATGGRPFCGNEALPGQQVAGRLHSLADHRPPCFEGAWVVWAVGHFLSPSSP